MVKSDRLLKKTIDALGIPCQRLKFDGKADEYVVYQLIVSSDVEENDDETYTAECLYRIDFFSKSNFTKKVESIVKALKKAGFYGITREGEIYEDDTKYYHVPLECKYLEEA